MNFYLRSCFVLLAVKCLSSSAMMIDGKPMSMDKAIIAAGSNNSKMFELMQDGETVMIELDMVYNMSKYMEMAEEMAQMEKDDTEEGSRKKRKAINGDYYRWPNARVPYDIDGSTMTASDVALIRSAISDYERFTCLRFPQATSRDTDRIRFQNGGGCSSYVGKIGNIQGISLARGCRYKGIIIHEMGHAIGFNHEQTRPDRGNYVTIHTQNIQRGLEYNFNRHTPNQQQDYGVPYDYTSVMHYSQDAFSANGRITIQAKQSQYQNAMGNRDGLSFKDIRLANAMYSCNGQCTKVECPAGGFQGQDCRCYCASGSRNNPMKVCGTVGPTVATEAPTAIVPSVCDNKQSSCDYWATQGYCTGDYGPYMMDNCPLSCRFCSAMTTTTTTTPTPTVSGSCNDEHQSCDSWANGGYCSTNTFVMSMCKKSCNLCSSSACMETNQYCSAWADLGLCQTAAYRDFMQTNCPISCNLCTANDELTTATPPKPKADCMNKRGESYCIRKQMQGKCAWSQHVMQGCRKTCDQC